MGQQYTALLIFEKNENVICRGGIVKTYIVAEMTVLFAKYHQTYLTSLPTVFHSIAPDKIQQQLMELRYNNLTNKWKICSVINSIVLRAKSF